jgi:hypothetical protein
MNPLNPPATLLVKLGSALVHIEELHSAGGHEFDRAAFDAIMADDEVLEWLAEMDKAALLPLKREVVQPKGGR